MVKRKRKSDEIDYILLGTVVVMMIFSVVMMYSICMADSVPDGLFEKHVRHMVLGLVVIGVAIVFPYTFLRNLSLPFLIGTIVILVLVRIIGAFKHGAFRSIETTSVSIQPGVIARLVAVIYVAAWAAAKGDQLRNAVVGLAPFGLIIGGLAGLIIWQPDYSVAMLIVLTGLLMFFYAGGDPFQIGLSMLLMALAGYAIVMLEPYVGVRFRNWSQEITRPELQGIQVYYTGLSFRAGGLLGVGLGNGQIKHGYLPLTYNDSVLAVIGEELGMVGVLLVIALFVLFAVRGYRVAMETPDPFGRFMAFGITTMIILSVIVHAAVMMHMLPFMGTALPFFTAGGSHMMVNAASVGILLSISRGKPKGKVYANLDRRWRNWWTRLSSTRRSTSRPSYGS